jgi:hypothetical protein
MLLQIGTPRYKQEEGEDKKHAVWLSSYFQFQLYRLMLSIQRIHTNGVLLQEQEDGGQVGDM